MAPKRAAQATLVSSNARHTGKGRESQVEKGPRVQKITLAGADRGSLVSSKTRHAEKREAPSKGTSASSSTSRESSAVAVVGAVAAKDGGFPNLLDDKTT